MARATVPLNFNAFLEKAKLKDDGSNYTDWVRNLRIIIIHYCMMLLTGHYDQRPFDETVCDAIIANGVVKNSQKRCKTFAMTDASNTVHILVLCAMQGIRLIQTNYL